MAKEIVEQLRLSLGDDFDIEEKLDDKYTAKTKAVQYEPRLKTPPPIFALVDRTKTSKLLDEIEKSNVSKDEKMFLMLAAYRHLTFNYSLIAEYYAHASKEMQRLMEKSALVIIDINDAIANGYVKLSENIEKIVRSNIKQEEQETIEKNEDDNLDIADLSLEDFLKDT